MRRLEDILAEIAAEQRAAGEAVAPGASAEVVAETAAALRTEIGTELPGAFARFLSLRNGLDFNGLSLHRCDGTPGNGQGLLTANRDLGLGRGVLAVGNGDMDMFTVAPGGMPSRMDRVGGDVVEGFGSVEEMLVAILEEHLRK